MKCVGKDGRHTSAFLLSFFFFTQGKGTMLTYFLNGREGFKKPLPDLSKAASLEEHTFK